MAFPLIPNKRVLGLKVEADAGVAETITASEVILKVYKPDLRVIEEPLPLDAQGHTGEDIPARGPQHTELDFQTRLYGAGATGAPSWGFLLQAAGYNPTVGSYAKTDVQSNWKTVSAAYWEDNRKKLGRGFMFNPVFTFVPGATVGIDWKGMGGYVSEPADDANVTGTYPSIRAPRWDGAGSLTIGGAQTHKVSQIVFDAGNKIALREDPISAGGYCTGWLGNPVPLLTLDEEAMLYATYNWYSKRNTPATGIVVVATVGTEVGNTITFTWNGCTPQRYVTESDNNARSFNNQPLVVTGAVTIAFT